ncbi:hypothetical protein HIM_05221 [Hirsutella minnesotensis 3608]|uniref:Ketosynthase family 3 (KS3) domain-containing protein n=1 Tax=Hirsutella minnesotensis 3608 TaxID=1043627 RepID=A0A0F7ZPD2_9HYPO|nr:hypothetical protein HIM_05221 [Hirsutella minnesotensis 3608]
MTTYNEPIAIVGNACRFAGGISSPSELWRTLCDPGDLCAEMTPSTFGARSSVTTEGHRSGGRDARYAYLLRRDVAKFDAGFFDMAPLQAKAMDPQMRMLLEVVYEALERAGIAVEALRGSPTSVSVGAMSNDYEYMQAQDLDEINKHTSTGSLRSLLSNRVSHCFGWTGPSVTLDSACSSSLAALDGAVQTLWSGQSRVALACGSSPIHQRAAAAWRGGRGPQETERALADGDDIECVIRQTGQSHNGGGEAITVPSKKGQLALIRSVFSRAGLDPRRDEDRPQYFEAHGTGTPVGDPVEAEAISEAFFGNRAEHEQAEPLYVGSVKTVLGHTESTAGIAGILKASLALAHAQIPPNLWFDNLSDAVAPFYARLQVPTAVRPWPPVRPGQPRRACVNSFGIGGANAHAILESYASQPPATLNGNDVDGKQLLLTPFVFSAKSRKSLSASLRAYVDHLDKNPGLSLDDLAWTLGRRRSALDYRTYFPASSSVRDLASISPRPRREMRLRHVCPVESRTLSDSAAHGIPISNALLPDWPRRRGVAACPEDDGAGARARPASRQAGSEARKLEAMDRVGGRRRATRRRLGRAQGPPRHYRLDALDSRPDLFQPSSSYWVTGLTGDLGISICEWMMSRGARNLVLSSRRPAVSDSWIARCRARGTRVVIVACDVSNEAEVGSAYVEICASMPPLAGVLHGAAVFRDVPLSSMSHQDAAQVLAPKVDGAIHLDRVLGSQKLDFFLLVSSASSLVGMDCQASYAGANCFLNSLAAQRRKRGLAAAAICLTPIVGAGYINRDVTGVILQGARSYNLVPASVEQVHAIIAEGIEAGRPGSPGDGVIATGFGGWSADDASADRFLAKPLLSHLERKKPQGHEQRPADKRSMTVAESLEACRTLQDVYDAVAGKPSPPINGIPRGNVQSWTADALVAYDPAAAIGELVKGLLQIDLPIDELMTMNTSKLGLDSVIPIDLRSAMSKVLKVSMPVLDIVRAKSMQSLARAVAERLLDESLPRVRKSNGCTTPDGETE